MKRTSCIAAAAGLALAASSLAACGGSGGGDAGGQVTIMVGGIDKVIYLPAMLTQQLGYFKDAGVNVKLLTEPSGASAETELVAHKVSGVVGFYDHTVTLQAQGQCIESVVQLAKVPGEVEMVSTKASGVSGPADFKGKKLGVTSPGSSTDYLTQYLATKNGVDPKDYTTVTAGAGSTFIAAPQQGAIDAGMTTDPTVETAINQGVGKVMLDLRTEQGTRAALGGLYGLVLIGVRRYVGPAMSPGQVVYAPAEWVLFVPAVVVGILSSDFLVRRILARLMGGARCREFEEFLRYRWGRDWKYAGRVFRTTVIAAIIHPHQGEVHTMTRIFIT